MIFLKGISKYNMPYAINIDSITNLFYYSVEDLEKGCCSIKVNGNYCQTTNKSLEDLIEEINKLEKEKENGKSRIL